MVEFGKERLAAEVAELQKLNLEVRERCVLEEVLDTGRLSKNFRPWSKDVTGFRVRDEQDCQLFAKTEVQFRGYGRFTFTVSSPGSFHR